MASGSVLLKTHIFEGDCTWKPRFEAYQWEFDYYWKWISLTKTAIPHQTRMCVPANSMATWPFQRGSKLLHLDWTILHVRPGMIKPKETHLYPVSISKFSAELCFLPKHKVVVHGTASPPFIISTNDDENIVGVLIKRTDSTIAAARYKLRKTGSTSCKDMERPSHLRHNEPMPTEDKKLAYRKTTLDIKKSSSKCWNQSQRFGKAP